MPDTLWDSCGLNSSVADAPGRAARLGWAARAEGSVSCLLSDLVDLIFCFSFAFLDLHEIRIGPTVLASDVPLTVCADKASPWGLFTANRCTSSPVQQAALCSQLTNQKEVSSEHTHRHTHTHTHTLGFSIWLFLNIFLWFRFIALPTWRPPLPTSKPHHSTPVV